MCQSDLAFEFTIGRLKGWGAAESVPLLQSSARLEVPRFGLVTDVALERPALDSASAERGKRQG